MQKLHFLLFTLLMFCTYANATEIGTQTTSENPNSAGANTITVNIITDGFSSYENSYQIVDAATGDILHNILSLPEYYDLHTNEFCLEDGCYIFTLFDSAGDGIFTGGQEVYELLDADGNTIASSDDSFSSSVEVQFCLPFDPNQVAADFDVSDSSLCTGAQDSVTITNNTVGNADTYSWSAPGAIPETSTEENPVFYFPTAGTYTITLTASNASSTDMTTREVEVIDGRALLIRLAVNDVITSGVSYQVTDQNTGDIVFEKDDFLLNSLNEEILCLPEGCYTFTVFDEIGDKIDAYIIGEITIDGLNPILFNFMEGVDTEEVTNFCLPHTDPYATFIIEESEICLEEPILPFVASANVDTYSWSAPGATPDTSTEENPEFTYDVPGTYTITLTVDGPNGSDTLSRDVVIQDGTVLKYFAGPNDYPSEMSVQITDQNTGEIVDESNNILFRERRLCLAEGCYTFTITNGGSGGGSYYVDAWNGDTIVRIFENTSFSTSEESFDFCYPYVLPNSDFSVPSSVICLGESITVNNTSTNAETYSWSAEGAMPETSTEENPTFSFPEAGTYTIQLATANATPGANDTLAQEIVVQPNPLVSEITGEALPLNGSTQTYTTPLNAGSTYSWFISGGMQVSGDNTNTIEVMWDDPDNAAYLCVTETDANGCESEEFCLDVNTLVSMNNIALEKGLRIFPNPTNGILRIESNEMPDNLEVFDAIGQRIQIDYQNNTLNLSGYATGVYLLHIIYEEGRVTRRIVVQ